MLPSFSFKSRSTIAKAQQQQRRRHYAGTICLTSLLCMIIIQSTLNYYEGSNNDSSFWVNDVIVRLATISHDYNSQYNSMESSSSVRQATTTSASTKRYPDLFRKTEGQGWKIWHDSDTPLLPLTMQQQQQQQQHGESIRATNVYNGNKEYSCHWANFRPRIDFMGKEPQQIILRSQQAQTHKMCLHSIEDDQWVSGKILREGRWPDCDTLPQWYEMDKNHNNNQDGWYIDIGANIGSCVMQVLLTSNATIAAFEPDPRNLFHLTNTLARLPPHLRQRVYVLPVALGAEALSSETIHVASDNRGNAAIGQAIQDQIDPNQQFLEPLPIVVERMDDLLKVEVATNNNDNDNTKKNPIRLVKMDAQGYECNIVQGASTILEATNTVVFELEPIMLRKFPLCNETILYDAFAKDGTRDMFPNNLHAVAGNGKPLPRMPKIKQGINLVARRRRRKEIE